MNESDRQEASYIRTLSSEEAATFLVEKYTENCPVTLKHRSWKKSDQFRLARQYVQGRAHATDRVYNDFLSFMSIDAFLRVIDEGLPNVSPDRLSLLSYYLIPSLRRVVKSEFHKTKVEEFTNRLSILQK